MATIYLVRHGRAAASWDAANDPGLDDLGREQARRVADALAPLGPLELVTSPMARTRETAVPLAHTWEIAPRIEPRVSEIPSPMEDPATRGRWLRDIAARNWAELDDTLRRWRDAVLHALAQTTTDTVVVTHYIAINAAVGAAVGDDRVVNFRPDYCSVTVLRRDGERLRLVERGAESTTRLL
jgi:broad specificity phosphatase PhoE